MSALFTVGGSARPLRILHLTTFYPPYSFGGDAMYVYRLSHALADEGHEVDVVHCVDAYHLLHPREPELAFAPHPGVRVHALRSGYGWLSPVVSHQTGRPGLKARAIRAIFETADPDVVHYHNVSLLGPTVLTTSPESRALRLFTAHDHWLVCPTHVLWKLGRQPCDTPACLPCTLRTGRPPQAWRYTGALARASQAVDQFIAPSRFAVDMHASRGFGRPVAHLPYFTDRADQDWVRPPPRPHDRPYFLFVGRLEPIKGAHTLVDLWSQVDDADLLIAGAGSEAASLRARAAGNPRVRFLGGVSPDRLGALYVHALACVVPSLTYETFGIVVIEAFARRTPVIVRDLGALPELVEESGGGLVYRSGAELRSALRRIAESPELRRDLGRRGYDTFVARWSREPHLAQYFDLLRDLARQRFGAIPWERAAQAG